MDMVNEMAMIPDLYFGDLWQDAHMANLLMHVLEKGGSRPWTMEAERVIALIPWERLEAVSAGDEAITHDQI